MSNIDEGKGTAAGTRRRMTKITLTCPTCRATKCISLDRALDAFSSGGIVNMFVPPATTPCHHPFGIYLDSNMKIRGYNKIDCILDDGGMSAPLEGAMVDSQDVGPACAELVKPKEIKVKGEAALTVKEIELKKDLDMLLIKLVHKVPEIEAIAIFDYEGYILTKMLPDSITIEEVAILASSLMTQSTLMGKALQLNDLEDFTLTSSEYKVMVKKTGDLLVMLYYGKHVKKGLMDLHVNSLGGAIEDLLVASQMT